MTSLASVLPHASATPLANSSSPLTPQHQAVTDGPYVFINPDNTHHASWICADQLIHTPVESLKVMQPPACQNLPEPSLNADLKLISADTYTGVNNIVALSDVHGQFDVMVQLLQAHGIIDEQRHWAFGDGHMVMTGDMFDRGPQVNEVLWLLYQLDSEATAAGGKLHLLMGNHEQMVLMGDLRYIHPRYQTTTQLMNTSYDALYDQDTEIGQWLRSKHTLVKINNALFMHGGISPEWLERQLSISQANRLYRRHIDDDKAQLKQDELLNFLFFSNGPTWYRGYFNQSLNEADIDKLLAYFDVDHIVVGHTSQTEVLGLYHNKIIAIDSSIKRGLSGELLLMTPEQLIRGHYNGDTQPLQAQPLAQK
ncbi:metallophosphoesterase [Shewanella sp. NIFS-20-20]|uniref:metallophosphoesterase n=1 Tax=Shewanella sp. NIFS-20-20 TaxID=2853806 RepID=UPI001C458D24|nr:metallophosphoesterase [Shewanella sp. NIFS-20-20]MBV7314969.1 metallophosphoesterase [Shewanella sp. NIFS-20-20]